MRNERAPIDYKSLRNPFYFSDEELTQYSNRLGDLIEDEQTHVEIARRGSNPLMELLATGELGIGVVVRVFNDSTRIDNHYILSRMGWNTFDGEEVGEVRDLTAILDTQRFGQPQEWFISHQDYLPD